MARARIPASASLSESMVWEGLTASKSTRKPVGNPSSVRLVAGLRRKGGVSHWFLGVEFEIITYSLFGAQKMEESQAPSM